MNKTRSELIIESLKEIDRILKQYAIDNEESINEEFSEVSQFLIVVIPTYLIHIISPAAKHKDFYNVLDRIIIFLKLSADELVLRTKKH